MISLSIWPEGGKLLSHKPLSRAVATSPPAKAPINIPKILIADMVSGDKVSTQYAVTKKPIKKETRYVQGCFSPSTKIIFWKIKVISAGNKTISKSSLTNNICSSFFHVNQVGQRSNDVFSTHT